jgi:mono/diheme cytochrome c family protein
MINFFKSNFILVLSVLLLTACGESDAPQEKKTAVTETTATQLSAEVAEATATHLPADVTEAAAVVEEKAEEMVAAATTEMDMAETTEAPGEASSSEPEAGASDKPYQVVDGKISANAIEGWKTYNGGGCGACHGKGGIGAVGPNLADSVTQKLSKEEFVNIVTNGKSGTMMRPHKTNTRVMENMDNLYAYLVARGDDVLGPGNLIKLPLGK